MPNEIPIRNAVTNADKSDNIGLTPGTPLQKSQITSKKIGRNDLCPCGSGKKYKKCHINSVPQNSEEQRMFDLYFSDHKEWERQAKLNKENKKIIPKNRH
jgi:hypothetical protein